MLEEYDIDNYTNRKFQYPSYQRNKFNSRIDVKFIQSQWTMKYRSRASSQCKCLKSKSMTIAMLGFIFAAITAAKKCILNSRFDVKY